ncbi:hypothetical protein LI82_02850 [Methanococcoides methylutens]|uniref:Uncharacterized protein n=1 Tax=Methanococcoides methylutens TaxID=2226 RepID=A0A099T475_METMT|nr:hypothetical protein [Methanococcoides methylutens]KGK98993.1 hypothetical protein LI82_02850 [Methanococcoides methylutens]
MKLKLFLGLLLVIGMIGSGLAIEGNAEQSNDSVEGQLPGSVLTPDEVMEIFGNTTWDYQLPDEAQDDGIVRLHEGTKYVYMVRNFSDPISLTELNEARNDVINGYYVNTSEKGASYSSIMYSVPQIPEGGHIVAYCFRINDEGITSDYVGIAGDERSVSRIHEKAETWYNNEVLGLENAEANTIADDELISNSSGQFSSESYTMSEDKLEIANKLYGTDITYGEYIKQVFPEAYKESPSPSEEKLYNMDMLWPKSPRGIKLVICVLVLAFFMVKILEKLD